MDIINGLKTRRSVRKFNPEKTISHEDIIKIVEAASYAPSAHNSQPWEFLIIEDKAKLASLRSLQPWTAFAKDASCVIIVCVDMQKTFHREKEGEQWSYADIDGTLAAYGILLAAHELGYGACFCGAAPMPLVIDNLQKAFNIPHNMRPIAIIPIGILQESPQQPKESRYQPEKTHWESWSK